MKVKNCPLCDGFAKLERKSKTVINGLTDYVTYVRCVRCDCRGPRVRLADFNDPTEARQLAVNKWNERIDNYGGKKNAILITLIRNRSDSYPDTNNFYISLTEKEMEDDVESVLRKKISTYLSSETGWRHSCDGDGYYNWNDFMNECPKEVMLTNRSTDYRIIGDVIISVDDDESLMPEDVKAKCYFETESGTVSSWCHVDFTTGNVMLDQNNIDFSAVTSGYVEILNKLGRTKLPLNPEDNFEYLI